MILKFLIGFLVFDAVAAFLFHSCWLPLRPRLSIAGAKTHTKNVIVSWTITETVTSALPPLVIPVTRTVRNGRYTARSNPGWSRGFEFQKRCQRGRKCVEALF